jgi:Kef-type K+ transport system membrane component KefB
LTDTILLSWIYILLIIAFAKALGEVLSRINQPAIVGELLAGIVLGPVLLGSVFSGLGEMYNSNVGAGEFIGQLADIGMLFLMLYVGLEFSPRLIKASSWLGGAIAAVGVAFPMLLGLGVGFYFGLSGATLAFTAIAMSVTALPVTIRILKDLEVLRTRTSTTIISAALITDVALLFALGIILGTQESATWETVVILSVSFASFFLVALAFGRYVVPYLYRLLRWMQTGEAAFALAIGVAIAFAVVAEWTGLPGVVGAFIAGLLLREMGTGLKVWARVRDILSGITLGFLAPIFFVRIGFSVDFGALLSHLPLFIAVTVVAILGKVLGSYVPARLGGLGQNESMAIGWMMMGKGAMELVFAQLALERGLFEGREYLFSVLVVMAFVSTILAPILFKVFFNRAVHASEIVPAMKGTDQLADIEPTSRYT